MQHLHRRYFNSISYSRETFLASRNVEKCCFAQTSVAFLGHSISADGAKPPPEKVPGILDITEPETVCQLRRFLGMLNFYRRFLLNAAQIQAPLYALYSGNKRNDKTKINWSDETRKDINTKIKSTSYVCTTVDIWSSRRRSFLGVTVHWLNRNFLRES